MAWDAILFDLDGTLWNATHITAKAWEQVLRAHPEIHRKVDLKIIQSLMGLTNEAVGQILFPELSMQDSFRFMKESCDWELKLLQEEGGHLYPETYTSLQKITARYPMGIISNCQAGYIETFLTYHKLSSLFQDHICSGDTGKEKCENIRMLCTRQGYRNPVYIGDTLGDAEAAEQAGCDFLWACYGFGQVPPEKRCGILHTLGDIFQYIG